MRCYQIIEWGQPVELRAGRVEGRVILQPDALGWLTMVRAWRGWIAFESPREPLPAEHSDAISP